jgi:integrase
MGRKYVDDPYAVTLTNAAMALLQTRWNKREKLNRGMPKKNIEKWVFPSDGATGHLVSPKTAWKRILERAGVTDLRIHDLRRTVGSYMAMQNISPAIIGKTLGHRSPTSTAIYARMNLDPVRAALEATMNFGNQKKADADAVVPLTRKKRKP